MSGQVTIQEHRGQLRLYWSWKGKRHFFYTGLPDDRLSRIFAEQKARQIEGDCLTGNFDATLRKYKEHEAGDRTSVVELFSRFMDWKARHIYSRSLEKYQATLVRLKDFFKNRAAASVTERDAERFRN